MAPESSSSDPLSPLHRAVLLTVLYGDLFDHPLTADELHRFLTAPCPDREHLDQAIEALEGRYLETAEGYIFWRGRESTLDVRKRRRRLAAKRWPPAHRFARWLSWVPFLRMVAVCGSQAVDNGDDDGDVDLFLITEPGRLWLVQSAAMVLRRLGYGLGIEVCPNYLLSADALEIEERSLYAAREATQAVPLWGREAYAEFLAVNRWIEDFLPQGSVNGSRPLPEARPRHLLTTLLERLLSGRLGDFGDRMVHQLLLRYYRLRLKNRGWQRAEIERAYRRDRQTVITGGYAAAVAQRFVEHGERVLGDRLSAEELRGFFFGGGSGLETPDPLYAGLMATRYGGGL